MDFTEVLGPKSYKEGKFFYELIENNKFSINSYNELIENLRKYKKKIEKNININKDIVHFLYHFMSLYIWTMKDFEGGKYKIVGVNNKDELFDYYEELDNEVMLLMNVYSKS